MLPCASVCSVPGFSVDAERGRAEVPFAPRADNVHSCVHGLSSRLSGEGHPQDGTSQCQGFQAGKEGACTAHMVPGRTTWTLTDDEDPRPSTWQGPKGLRSFAQMDDSSYS